MLAELDDYDWAAAFNVANGGKMKDCEAIGTPTAVPPGETVSEAPFDREDVAEIIGMSDGERDEADWIIAGRLHDGRWFYLEAGCDYTGWD